MRVVVVVIAALMTLGLAAFGVVAAQNSAGPASLLAFAAHVISPTQSNSTPPQPAPVVASQVPARPVANPVVQVSDTVTTPLPVPSSAAPIVVAQNTASVLPN